jgi:hypothetical protein
LSRALIRRVERLEKRLAAAPERKPMFPRHLTLTLEHNPHKLCSQPLAEYLDDHHRDVQFETDAERDRALAEDSLWVLQWYPDTPVGFLAVAAADPVALIRYAWRVLCASAAPHPAVRSAPVIARRAAATYSGLAIWCKCAPAVPDA